MTTRMMTTARQAWDDEGTAGSFSSGTGTAIFNDTHLHFDLRLGTIISASHLAHLYDMCRASQPVLFVFLNIWRALELTNI